MAVFKRGGVYWYEFVFNGTRIRESTNTGNQNAARQIEAARKLALAKGQAGIEPPAPVPTLRGFSDDFMKQIRMDCASKQRTIEFYREKLDRLLADPRLADCSLDRIDEDAIEAYKRTRTSKLSRFGRMLSPASVNRELATLRRLLRVAKSWKRIAAVPEIKLLRGERSREFVLSREDEPRYLAALSAGMRPFCEFLIDTGLRVGEGLALEWPRINLRESPAYVTVRAITAKNSKPRTVPLTERAREILEAVKDRRAVVFRNADGEPLYHTWLDQQHADVRGRLGFSSDFVLHSLRHTFGTRLGETGADAFTIMRLMGHSSVTVSQKYVHPSSESMRMAIERMSKAGGVPTNTPTALKVVKSRKRVSCL